MGKLFGQRPQPYEWFARMPVVLGMVVTVWKRGGYIVTGKWSENEVCQTSTRRELQAVHLVLQDLGPKLKNHRVRWFTDNQNVARIVFIGSRKPILHEEAMTILSIFLHQQIRLKPKWIPREENEFPDYLSRVGDVDD